TPCSSRPLRSSSPRIRPRRSRWSSTSSSDAFMSPMPTDRPLRIACAAVAVALAVIAYALQGLVDPPVHALARILTFLLIIASCSSNLRAVNVRTVVWGVILQLLLALFILKFEIFGYRPGYAFFSALAAVAKRFLEFTSAGSTFVFGDLARPEVLGK